MKNRVLWINAVVFLCLFNYLIFQKEKILSSGKEIYLELVPLDPRSLLQGDYMSLRYRIADRGFQKGDSEDGFIVAKLDANRVGTLSRPGSPTERLGPDEIKIKYRRRGTIVKIATDAFFFQNGRADYFSSARYGVLKVDDDGEVLLVGVAKAPGEIL